VTLLEHNRAELEAMLAVLKENRDEISRKNRELEILATQDSLTGCFNRRAFFERFDIAFRFSKQYNVPLACVMVDNDHFKSVNDNYGHHIGDEVLRKVGALLRKLHSDAQVVCRFGGEEFCIMLPGYDLADAAAAAERIRVGITEIRLNDPAELRLSASIGVSDMTFGAAEPQVLINQADACLYVAKRSGRNRVACYDPSMADIDTEASEPRVDAHAAKKQDILSPSSPPVRSLLSALAFRDADTAEHSRRVANHCVRTGSGFLNNDQLNLIEVAGLLHDIGKIGVPDHILLKPGALTDAEWKLMGLHDQISVEIVANLIESEDLLSIIRFHHCKFGGDIIDDGPVGEAIPVAARILTIADSYDAMVSDRVYRQGRTHEEAIAELRRCAGRQFDPQWVERFVASFQTADSSPAKQGSESNPAVHAVHFSKQIERLVDAVDAQDPKFVKNLTQRVRKIALGYQLDDVAVAALKLEGSVEDENQQWEAILEQTETLIDVCRAAQDRMIRFE
jgi:diguanylate cyclase (GGDEF)-like protein